MNPVGLSLDPPGYSRAFEKFVTDGDGDVVGLLAYALYKQAIREAAIAGEGQSGNNRNPSPTTVKVHRDAAERLLTKVADDTIERVRPEIEASALRRSVEEAEVGIKAHVDDRTGFWTAVLAGGVAWVASLILTVLIIWLSGRGDIVSTLLKQ